MKFIRKNKLDEGLFGTKDQMKKRMEREAELSDEDIIVGEARSLIEKNVRKIICEIFKQNEEMFEVFDTSYFSYHDTQSMSSIYADVDFLKKDLSVKVENENNKNVIHLSLDLGGFRISSSKNLCDSIVFPHLISKNQSTKVEMQWSEALKKEMLTEFNPVLVKKKICNRLRRLLNKVTPKKNEEQYYNFIANSKIVLDEIAMYTNSSIDKLTIHLEDAVAVKKRDYFISSSKNNFDDREEIYLAYKPILDEFANLITMRCPIVVTSEVRRVVDNGYPGTKDLLFHPMNKFGYPNFGSFESELGRNPYVTIKSIAIKYFKEVYGKLSEDTIKELRDGFSKCSYFDISYSTYYSGKIVPEKGFVIDKDHGVLVNFFRVTDSEDNIWNTKYTISVRRTNIDVDARRSPIKITLRGNIRTGNVCMEKLYEYGSIEHKSLSMLLDHSLNLIIIKQ